MAHLDLQSTTYPSHQGHTDRHYYARYGKRALDVIVSAALLPFLLPIIALLFLLVRLDGGPALFSHARIGQHGRAFSCFKIRTMVTDAEARLADHLAANPHAAAEWAATQKLTHDPRVTRLGRVLRKCSLDELPQIINVLRGEMSLVGPRPITAPELDRYGPHASVYLSLKPGVTGLWQVFGRADGCYDERLRLDQVYASDMGMWRDLTLISRTALVVVRPTGR